MYVCLLDIYVSLLSLLVGFIPHQTEAQNLQIHKC